MIKTEEITVLMELTIAANNLKHSQNEVTYANNEMEKIYNHYKMAEARVAEALRNRTQAQHELKEATKKFIEESAHSVGLMVHSNEGTQLDG